MSLFEQKLQSSSNCLLFEVQHYYNECTKSANPCDLHAHHMLFEIILHCQHYAGMCVKTGCDWDAKNATKVSLHGCTCIFAMKHFF